MTPLWTASGTCNLGGGGGFLAITLPPAAVEGDVALVMFAGGPTAPSDPVGWTLVGTTTATPTSSGGRMTVWTRALTGSDIIAGQLSLSMGSTSRSSAAAVGYPDGTVVTDAVLSAINGFSTSAASPAATADLDDSTVAHLYGVLGDVNGTIITWTPHASTTEIIQESAESGFRNGTLLVAYEEQGPGVTTSRTATASATVQTQAATVVLWLETGVREATDPVGLTDSVSAVLQVGSVTVTDQVGISDSDDPFSLDVASTDAEPVGLTDTVIAVLANPLLPIRTDPVEIADTVTAVLLGPAATPAARTITVRADDRDGQVPGYVKDPDALLDWAWDWSAWLSSGEQIASHTVIAPVGITVVATTRTTSTVTVWLSGGTPGRRYQVTCRVTSNQGPAGLGRKDDRSFAVTAQHR